MARFLEVFEDVTKEGHKIPKESYLPEGLYPIIDQGQGDIAGYSNEKTGLYESVPAIIQMVGDNRNKTNKNNIKHLAHITCRQNAYLGNGCKRRLIPSTEIPCVHSNSMPTINKCPFFHKFDRPQSYQERQTANPGPPESYLNCRWQLCRHPPRSQRG